MSTYQFTEHSINAGKMKLQILRAEVSVITDATQAVSSSGVPDLAHYTHLGTVGNPDAQVPSQTN